MDLKSKFALQIRIHLRCLDSHRSAVMMRIFAQPAYVMLNTPHNMGVETFTIDKIVLELIMRTTHSSTDHHEHAGIASASDRPADDFHSILFSVLAQPKSRSELLLDQVELTALSQRLGNSSFDLVFTSNVSCNCPWLLSGPS